MTELQNNPEPGNYLIERAGSDLRSWRVIKDHGSEDGGTVLGAFDTYTDAVAAINEDRGVDTEDLKREAATPHPMGTRLVDVGNDDDKADVYDDDWDDYSEVAPGVEQPERAEDNRGA